MTKPKSYIISDLHLDHENIIRYCNRPFSSLSEMNRTLVSNWNDTVDTEDNVFFLGDLCMGNPKKWLGELNGNKILVRGNHDKSVAGMRRVIKMRSYSGENFLMIHAPEWVDRPFRGWIFHGHHHNNKLDDFPLCNHERKTMNVSAELLDYRPIEIIELLKRRKEYL